jgi:hypothetical protein
VESHHRRLWISLFLLRGNLSRGPNDKRPSHPTYPQGLPVSWKSCGFLPALQLHEKETHCVRIPPDETSACGNHRRVLHHGSFFRSGLRSEQRSTAEGNPAHVGIQRLSRDAAISRTGTLDVGVEESGMTLALEIQWSDGSEESIELPVAGISQLTTIDVVNRTWLTIIALDNVTHYINLHKVRSLREVATK